MDVLHKKTNLANARSQEKINKTTILLEPSRNQKLHNNVTVNEMWLLVNTNFLLLLLIFFFILLVHFDTFV